MTATVAVALVVASVGATAALAEGPEQIPNGTFDAGKGAWWSTGNAPADVVDGELCAVVTGATTQKWDAIMGLDNVPLVAGETYAFAFDAHASSAGVPRAVIQLNEAPSYPTYFDSDAAGPINVTTTKQRFSFTFTATASLQNAQLAFQIGGQGDPWTFCVDNISLTGGAEPEQHEWNTDPRIHVNQVGYLPKGPKNATLTTEVTDRLTFTIKNAGGTVVHTGRTRPRGLEKTSNQRVHSLDFSDFTTPGTGYTLEVDGVTSHPFDLSDAPYEQLRKDAVEFFYPMRSGIAIDNAIAPGYGRPAGHIGVAPNQGDTAVPCEAPKDDAGNYIGPRVCDYTLDVSGGWYDAGDHGKYVVNGGIAAWQLLATFERTKNAASATPGALGDGTLALPESGNGVPDILDEARWELEFLLKMQVPAGKPKAGMAHHSVHDQTWTGVPLLPSNDDKPRELTAPSTAASLNLAAVGAQGARLFAAYDPAFSAKLLAAAKTAYAAALANPAIFAPATTIGGGPYDDTDVADEFYWAAAELFITTGDRQYGTAVTTSPQHTADVWAERGFDWKHVAQLARLDLATVPNALSDRDKVRRSVIDGAKKYLDIQKNNAFGLPYSPADNEFDWGSNNLVLNNAQVMATAFDITGDEKYRNGALQTYDYILGRNAINQSYVTGYGEVSSQNQHNRWFAKSVDPNMPPPPPGSLAGGPNSQESTWDPTARSTIGKCLENNQPQFCYLDHVQSWSTNEVAINWNSTLTWAASFAADQNDGTRLSAGRCDVSYHRVGNGSVSVVAVTVRNTGSRSIDGWELQFAFLGGQKVNGFWNANVTQAGATVSARNVNSNRTIRPGQTVAVGFLVNADPNAIANPNPELLLLNGAACG